MIPKQCEVCKRTDGLLRCGGCSTYYYCCREHQVADRPTHKTTCNTIKRSKAKVQEEEAKLRTNATSDANTPPNVLDTEVGSLWIWKAARPYLQALFVHGETLIRSWRRQGIEDALTVYLDLLRLNKGDNQGSRFLIPGLYLRLGRDQDAYDFCKGWVLQFKGKVDESIDSNAAYLHTKNADAIEGVDIWTGKHLDLTHAACVQLIKVRLLLGLQAVQQFKAARPAGAPALSPQELLAAVREHYCGDILERKPELIADDEAIDKTLGNIADQIGDLFQATGTYNKHFWPMILDPEEKDFSTGPMAYTFGSEQEAHNTFMHVYGAWAETPRAIEGVRNIISEAMGVRVGPAV